jgi:sodium-coupled neutral amino acid transporter 11
MNVSRLLFSITILLTYPIECFVCREVVQNVIWGNDQFQQMDEKAASTKHIIITVIIVGLTYVFSMFTDCLGIVLEINVNCLVAPLRSAFLRKKIKKKFPQKNIIFFPKKNYA